MSSFGESKEIMHGTDSTSFMPSNTSDENELREKLIALRRDIHTFPELGWQEFRTTDKVEAWLNALGIEHRRLQENTGLIAEIKGSEDSKRAISTKIPWIALRADIDALPLDEETGLSYSSKAKGVMHACGHDGHIAMLAGAAALLLKSPAMLPVRLIFQPAEEIGDGAPAMIKAGALDNVAMIFGGHIDRQFPAGTIAVTDGTVNASTDTFIIELHGKGGHAARPHETIDCVVAGSMIVLAIQTLVSREVNPASPAVVTVGLIQSGTVSNVIAGHCRMEGTIRTHDATVRKKLKDSLIRLVKAQANSLGAEVTIKLQEGLPPLVNWSEPTEIARKAVRALLGEAGLDFMRTANMGGEDFACYVQNTPGCYVRFGAQVPDSDYPAHSSRFTFDENCLMIGASYFAEVARQAASKLLENLNCDMP